jgi:hypothetical protein
MASHLRKGSPSRRKRAITVLIIILAAAAIAGLILFFIDRAEKNEKSGSIYSEDVYEKDPNRFAVYDPDEPSIFEDEKYLSLDRSLHVRRFGEEFTVTDKNSVMADGAALFFIDYFDALSRGDTARYNEMFSDSFYETHEREEEFSEQRVYDIHVTLLGESDGLERVSYKVEYKIQRNNGTFRRDIYSDSTRPLIFDLVRDGDTYKIDGIKYS